MKISIPEKLVLIGVFSSVFTFPRLIARIKLSEFFFTLAMVTFLLEIFIRGVTKLKIPDKILLVFLAIFIILNFFSGVQQFLNIVEMPRYVSELNWAHGKYNPEITWITEVFRYFFIIILVLLPFQFLNRDKLFYKKIVKVFIIGGICASLVGLIQLANYFFGADGSIGIQLNHSHGARLYLTNKIWSIGWFGLPRLTGPNNEPSMFGNTLIVVFPFILYGFIYRKFLCRKFLGLGLISIISMLFFTNSYGAYVGLALALLLLILYDKRLRKKALPIIVIILIILSSIQSVREFTLIKFNPINQSVRIENILIAWNIFSEYPLLGVGAGNFPFFRPKFSPREHPCWESPFVGDNFWTTTLAQLGFIGLLCFLFFFFYILFRFFWYRSLLRKMVNKNQREEGKLGVYALAGFFAGFAQLLFTYGIFNPHLWMGLIIFFLVLRDQLHFYVNQPIVNNLTEE